MDLRGGGFSLMLLSSALGVTSVVDADEPNAPVEPRQFIIEARALLSECIVNALCPDPSQPYQAEALLKTALESVPNDLEGRMQMAIALSMQARDMPMGEARKGKYAERMKSLAESVLADDADNAWAHGFLAVWHVEVRRRGGPIGAAIMGANLDQARSHFKACVAAEPQNLVLQWQYARALAALDAKRYAAEIQTVLSEAQGIAPSDAVEDAVQLRANNMLLLITHQDYAQAEELSRTKM